MHQPPTGTVTFLFTDIQGSTGLWESNPDTMRPALARHDQLLRRSIEGNDGYVFKTVGDAFCAAFSTAPQALQATLDAQLALAAEPWETETPLLVRMALHTGSAEERDGDYFGQPLNRVARLMAAGHGGQTLLSLATQELTRDALPTSASLLDLGPHRLKDLARPETVFQLLHPLLSDQFPPLKSLNNPALPNNLPQQVTSFIGREKQVTEVKALLLKSRLLTLTGAGGSGKTRLSLQVAADLLDGKGDGVWLVELASLSDPALVPQAIATVLGVQEQVGKSVQQVLVEWLKAKRLLLIFDNCEHLVSACASLTTDLLRSCPDIHILASSREPLNVAGEQTYPVPTLMLPDPKVAQTAESLSQYEAVWLFIERAQAVMPSFLVTDANAPAVAQVCWRLDGIPLAIELAAARVYTLSVQQIVERLDNRFQFLTGVSCTLLPRQQTLSATLDWSYHLLNEQEKVVFQYLSVFAGGWTLEAAEAVCVTQEISVENLLNLLESLTQKSLIFVSHFDDEARFGMLETIHKYAQNLLIEDSKIEEARRQHLSYFLSKAEQTDSVMSSIDLRKWVFRLEREYDNLRVALDWCETQTAIRTGSDNIDIWLRLCGALGKFWLGRVHISEGRERLAKVLNHSHENLSLRAKAKVINVAAQLAVAQGDYKTASGLYHANLDFFRNVEEPEGISESLNGLGTTSWLQGNLISAQDFYQQALYLQQETRQSQAIANTFNNLGNVASGLNDHARARVYYQDSLDLMRPVGDIVSIANTLNNLGAEAVDQKDYPSAHRFLQESLSLAKQVGDLQGVANCLLNMSVIALKLNNYVEAGVHCHDSLEVYNEIGDQRGIAYAMEKVAIVAALQGDIARMGRLIGAAAAIRTRIGTSGPSMYGRTTASMQKNLRRDLFSVAWREGNMMTLDRAVEYALSSGTRDSSGVRSRLCTKLMGMAINVAIRMLFIAAPVIRWLSIRRNDGLHPLNKT